MHTPKPKAKVAHMKTQKGNVLNAVTLELLIRAHYRFLADEGEDEDNPDYAWSPAQKAGIEWALQQDLLKPEEGAGAADGFALTERGQAYVNHLLTIPLPESQTIWVVPTPKGD